MQPWRFEAGGDVIRALGRPTRTSLLDFRDRAALLALGAALEAAKHRRARARLRAGRRPCWRTGRSWELALERRRRPRDERACRVLWQRCCNRRTGASRADPGGRSRALARCGAPLDTRVVARRRLRRLGAALGALDRVRFLSRRLRGT